MPPIVRDVVIKFSAEDKDLKRGAVTLDQVNTKVKQVEASTVKAQKTIQTTGKESVSSFNNMSTSLKGLAASIGLAFGVGTIVEFGKKALALFKETEQNVQKLSFAIRNLANGSTGDIDRLVKQANVLQAQGIFSDDTILNAQRALLTIGLTVDQVEDLVPKIANLGAATGNFDEALGKVIAGINGQTRGLKEVGIVMKDTGSKTENLTILSDKLTKFQGSMSDALNTSAGAAANLNNKFEDLLKVVGGQINKELQFLKAGIVDLFSGNAEQTARLFISRTTASSIEALKEQFDVTKEEGAKAAAAVALASAKTIKNDLQKLLQSGELTQLQFKLGQQQIGDLLKFREDLLRKGNEQIVEDSTKVLGDNSAEELTKMRQRLEDVQASLLADEADRAVRQLQLSFERELEQIQGNTETANALKLALREKFNKDIADLEEKFEQEELERLQKQIDEEEKREKEQAEKDEKEAEEKIQALKDFNERRLEIERTYTEAFIELENAQSDAIKAGAELAKAIFGENAGFAKALFLFQQGIAVVDVIRNLQVEIAGIAANPFLTALPDAGTTVKAAKIATAKIRAGIAIGSIVAQTIPELKFAEGVIDLKRDGHPIGRDTIPAMLDEGESVMTRDETKRHRNLLQAIRDERLDSYLMNEALPKLQLKYGDRWLGAGGNTMATFDEEKMGRVMRRNNSVNVRNIDEIAKALTQNQRKERMFKRRGVS